MSKPLILISNDDGVQAKGICSLIDGVREFGDILVVAPDGPRSGMSGAITSTIPIKASLLKKEEGLTIYSCTGTPVDCVKLAMNQLTDRKPDLVISGINHGSNMAICVHYSGTVGAAIEGCIFGVPSIAVSVTDHSPDADFGETVRLLRQVVPVVLKEGLPAGTYLNMNVPNIPEVKGIKVKQQAAGKWINEYMCSENALGHPVYWLTGDFCNSDPENPENDTTALDNGYASLVPCKIDVTDYNYLDTLNNLFS
ncbi:MAG: 5'/3'-nucleotidase SurE [Tannerellaceae bacterium]|nr:5'/3'-nucleotidase SurE [Tannerellaceae bacterium]